MAWEPHQHRVAVEAEELRDKLAKLQAFVLTPTYRALPVTERGLMRRQMFVMTDYLHTLSDRMVLFDGGYIHDPER